MFCLQMWHSFTLLSHWQQGKTHVSGMTNELYCNCRMIPTFVMGNQGQLQNSNDFGNEILLCSAGNYGYLWWNMVMWEKRMYTCMYNWVTMMYSRKKIKGNKKTVLENISYKSHIYSGVIADMWFFAIEVYSQKFINS